MTASVERAKPMPEHQVLEPKKGLMKPREEEQLPHGHRGSWKGARLAQIPFSAANT